MKILVDLKNQNYGGKREAMTKTMRDVCIMLVVIAVFLWLGGLGLDYLKEASMTNNEKTGWIVFGWFSGWAIMGLIANWLEQRE